MQGLSNKNLQNIYLNMNKSYLLIDDVCDDKDEETNQVVKIKMFTKNNDLNEPLTEC